MSVEIGLIRGINVGGKGVLPMAELRVLLAGLGARDVRTYIQSGNAAWAGHVDERALADAIEASRGFRPEVMILPIDSFAAVAANNPFPEVDDPKALHVFFLGSPSLADEAVLDAVKGPQERFQLTERALYLHLPNYLSGSPLTPRLERLLGVPATGRNWRSVEKILEMAREIDA
jgi:uncharacterized protein (DUF1697 family)